MLDPSELHRRRELYIAPPLLTDLPYNYIDVYVYLCFDVYRYAIEEKEKKILYLKKAELFFRHPRKFAERTKKEQ